MGRQVRRGGRQARDLESLKERAARLGYVVIPRALDEARRRWCDKAVTLLSEWAAELDAVADAAPALSDGTDE